MAQTKELMLGFIDQPSAFDSLQTWERHLNDLRALPSSQLQREMVRTAEKMIARKKTSDR